MKIRNGMPTIKSLCEICDKHGLIIYPMGSFYHNTNRIVFSRSYQNEKAELVNKEISELFNTYFRPADDGSTNGMIEILSKKEQPK